MDSDLGKFHTWLSLEYTDYISMIAIGSIAVGDTWIEGRSDHDILLIFQEIPTNFSINLEEHLKNSTFDETYLFTPLPKSILIGPKNHSHDFSNKFRSKTLYGVDLILDIKLPTMKVTESLYEKGLERVLRRMETRIAHTSLWPDEKVRTIFWKLFKHIFMNLAIKAYTISGNFPRKRQDVVDFYNSPELQNTLSTLNSINKQSKKSINSTAKELVKYLQTQIN